MVEQLYSYHIREFAYDTEDEAVKHGKEMQAKGFDQVGFLENDNAGNFRTVLGVKRKYYAKYRRA